MPRRPWDLKLLRTFSRYINRVISASRSLSSDFQSSVSEQLLTQGINDCHQENIFRYSSGRWLWNEDVQLAARRVKFDIQALCSLACNSIGSSACSTITKLPEGNFNKTFLFSMTDGREVIAKIPNPNSGRPGFSTASEVATMDFVKNCLGIPVPEIYAWSSQADETAVGAEFIIMQKAPGIQLSEVWDTLHSRQRFKIVQQLVKFQSSFVAEFPAYGSLYYSGDLPATASAVELTATTWKNRPHTFCVGPTNNRKYFDDGRGRLHLDRGPWRTLEEYVIANAQREQISIREIKKRPLMRGLFRGPGQYQPSNATKQRVLEDYQQISTLVLPRVTSAHAPALSHSDLHTSNIFVDPLEHTRITCIIDWQGAHVAPLFMQVRHPALLDFDGPIPEGLKLPPRPENYSQLDTEARLEVDKLRAVQSLYKLYEVELLQQCKPAGLALQNRYALTNSIHMLAGSIFTDGEPVMLGYLIKVVEDWKAIVGFDADGNSLIRCPLTYSEEMKKNQMDMEEQWNVGVLMMNQLIEDLGVYSGWDGLVNNGDYQVMKLKLADCKERFLQKMAKTKGERDAWSSAWPFQDQGHRNGDDRS